MALQQLGPREHDDESTWTDDEEESFSSLLDTTSTAAGFPMETSTDPFPSSTLEGYGPWKTGHPYGPGHLSSVVWPGWPRPGYSGSSTLTTKAKETPYGDNLASSTTFDATNVATNKNLLPSTSATNAAGRERPDWAWAKKHSNGPMYAAAAIVPIVVLAIIGGIAFCCLRKRKRQRVAVARAAAQEMKMRPRTTAPPYTPTAPAPAVAAHYGVSANEPPPTSDPSAPPPVILGPIPSGDNGAYLTGIDTSDVVSITSNNLRPVDPFADNSSLAEPPPPYRPRSAAPPSFVSASRQSSFRVSDPQPAATSQTHLIERSPFDDPPDNEDTVSEMSGPTERRGEDTMSVVSDLSYQNDPVLGRTSV